VPGLAPSWSATSPERRAWRLAAVSFSVTVASLAAVAGLSGVTLTSVPATTKGAVCAFAEPRAGLFLAGSWGLRAIPVAGTARSAPAAARQATDRTGVLCVFERVIRGWLPHDGAQRSRSHGLLMNRGHPYSERV